jgi:tetratricopeptide (TPR) repeat protein
MTAAMRGWKAERCDAPVAMLVLVPLESARRRALVLGLSLVLAAWLAIEVTRPAVAWYAGRGNSIPGLTHALAWDPRNADAHVRLGHAYANLVPAQTALASAHYAAAIRLRPTDAYPRLLLALLANRQDDRAAARAAIEQALQLDPENVALRWEAALLALGWGEREIALPHFKYVLGVDPAQRDAAFQLARTLLQPGEDPATLLPGDVDGLTNVLAAALRQEDLVLAAIAWRQRVALEPALPEEMVKRYVTLALDKGEGALARAAWVAVVGEGGVGPIPEGNPVWNGGFETERLQGWGLDWRVRKTWGVDVALDRFVAAAGSRSLRFAFNSFPSLDFAGVTQLVAVEPERNYHLRALARATDFTTRSGLKLQVVVPGLTERLLAETPMIAGTTGDWVPLETAVTIPPGTRLVLLRVRREPAREPEGNLGGKVWLDEVTLQ